MAFPLLSFAFMMYGDDISFYLSGGIVLVSVFLSLIVSYYIEKPVQHLKPRVFIIWSVLFLFIIVIVWYFRVGYVQKISQFPDQDREFATIDLKAEGKYITEKFNLHEGRHFPRNSKPNVLIIGDSFAKDVVNSLYESGMIKHINLSVHHIHARCGNLFVNKKEIDNYIVGVLDKRFCLTEVRYNDRVRDLLSRADDVILASAWTKWQIEMLPESINNIRNVVGGSSSVYVFGPKDFGVVSAKVLLNSDDSIIKVSEKLDMNIVRMKELLPQGVFIDVQHMMCGNYKDCNVMYDSRLITKDGTHLTKYGAALLGKKLKEAGFYGRILYDENKI